MIVKIKYFSALLKIFYLLTILCSTNVEGSLLSESIVGGDKARPNQLPYMLSVQKFKEHVCGGSILGERFGLTAAHCLMRKDSEHDDMGNFDVVPNVLQANDKSTSVKRYQIVRAFVPKEYVKNNPNSRDPTYRETADIAVFLTLDGFGLGQQSILRSLGLPATSSSFEGQTATVAGYGWDKPPSKRSSTSVNKYELKYAKATVISNSECATKHQRAIRPSHLCARMEQRDPRNPQGLCTSDSGGPLVLDDNTVIAVVSYGPQDCNESDMPGVYTRMTSYTGFLTNVLGGDIKDDIQILT